MLRPGKVVLLISLVAILFLVLVGFTDAESNKEGIVTASSLNMRENPEISSDVVTTIEEDKEVEILDEKDEWYKVRYDSIEGWVYSQYISILGDTISLGTINAVNVNIRSYASLVADVVKQLDTGVKVKVLERTGDWYKISFPAKEGVDEEGWVYKDYLSVIGEAITKGEINGNDVNVRNEPSLNSDKVTQLAVNTEVDIYGKAGEWYLISLENEEFGWVFGKYVTLNESFASRGESEELLIREIDLEGASSTQHALIEFARKYLGVRYVWGGESPSGFDCSGLVLYVYRQFGVNLPHNAAMQAQRGTTVKRADLKPGDAVFFDTNGGHNHINHVGLYVGNGKFIHASSSRSGAYVKVSDLSGFYSDSYMTAKRYIN